MSFFEHDRSTLQVTSRMKHFSHASCCYSPLDTGIVLPSKPAILVDVGVDVFFVVAQLDLVPFAVVKWFCHACKRSARFVSTL